MQIRSLDPASDLAAVQDVYDHALDYWALDRLRIDTAALAHDFFTDAPPNCDPAASHRLGLFEGARLAGIAELSFGFPTAQDAYLGLMILADWARNRGQGVQLLCEVESRARAKGHSHLYLGVLDNNPKGRAFWIRQGFADTGISRLDTEGGVTKTIQRLVKPL